MRRLLPLFALCSLTAFAACNAAAPPPVEGEPAGTSGAGATNGGGGDSAAGTGGGSGSGVGIGGSGITDDDACASADYPAGRVPASLLFVWDRSGSMSDSASGGDSGGLSKWSVAVDAVGTALDGIDLEVDLGFMLFPAGKFDDTKLATCILNASSPQCAPIVEDGGCKDIDPTPNVLMSPIKESRPKIQALLNNTDPNGGTPTRWALQYGYDYLKTLETAGERYVVLVTDGQPNVYGANPIAPNANKLCGTLGDIAAATTAAYTGSPQIRTFVIGSPGDTDPAVLSGIALNGGTAKAGCTNQNYKNKECHYQLSKNDFGDGLLNALKDIASKASNGCTFAVPAGANSNPDFVNVQAEGPAGKVGILKDTSHENGWDYTDESKSKVEVHGPLCDQLRNGELLTVKVLTGCKTKEAN